MYLLIKGEQIRRAKNENMREKDYMAVHVGKALEGTALGENVTLAPHG